MQQLLEREIKAVHAWAKLAPGKKKTVEGDQQHVDYTLVVDGIKLAVAIAAKIPLDNVELRTITARELAILDSYKSGGIWKFAYILDIRFDEVRYLELNQLTGQVKGNQILFDTKQWK